LTRGPLTITKGNMQPGHPNWYAVVSKPRQEQIALENLQRQGFKCFLPMAENPYQRRSKNDKPIIEALFPRYLFLNAIATEQNLAPVRSTRGVISMVRFGIELAVVPDAIIQAIENRMEANTGLIKIKPVPVRKGNKVRVFDGPLAGINGVVTERKGEGRARILMELLGRPTEIEVDALILQCTG
jgi:transcriptional antiterminator RfaH